MKKFHTNALPFAATLMAAGLAGCSRSEPEVEPAPNAVEESVAPVVEPLPTPEPNAVPAAESTADTNATAELPPEEPAAPDEQMMDDASATGMTARSSRDEEKQDAAEPVANEGTK